MTDTQRLDFIIAHDYEIVPRKGLWNILQMDEGGMSQTAINTHPDLRTAIDQQTRRRIPHVQLRVVLHGLDEIQLILSEEGIALHG